MAAARGQRPGDVSFAEGVTRGCVWSDERWQGAWIVWSRIAETSHSSQASVCRSCTARFNCITQNGEEFALLVAVPERFSRLSYRPVPNLSLSDLPHRVRQPDRVVHRPHHRPGGGSPPARVPDRPVHPRRRPQGPPEESRHADHGRLAHRGRHDRPNAVVGRSEQSFRVDCGVGDPVVRRDRFRRRLSEGGAPAQPWADRARQAAATSFWRRL